MVKVKAGGKDSGRVGLNIGSGQTIYMPRLLSVITPGTPSLNAKVEQSHRTDRQEFYLLFKCTGDIDLNRKLQKWERFYNFHRPHSAHKG